MPHSIDSSSGTATLETFSGLTTFASPQDLPEGAAARATDCAFSVGSVFQRPGLASVYSYTAVLNITEVVLVSGGIGTFSYNGGTAPTVNEAFTLGDFTGKSNFLNGQTIIVISVDISAGTFLAANVTGIVGTYTNLVGTATSEVGNFVGPNIPNVAFNESIGNIPWSNPDGIIGDASYASVTVGNNSSTAAPTAAVNFNWTNPQYIYAVSLTNFASVTTNSSSAPLNTTGAAFSIPANATIVGVAVNLNGYASKTGGAPKATLSAQLLSNGTLIGDQQTVSLNPTTASAIGFGSSSYLWGTSLTAAQINSSTFGVQFIVSQSRTDTTAFLNGCSFTVVYTLVGSDALISKSFSFVISPSSGITGFENTFKAYTNGTATVIAQLLKNGVPVGTSQSQVLTNAPTVYSLGSSINLWGASWLASDVNAAGFGVQYTATGTGTVFVQDADLIIYITPSLTNFNYIKSYFQDNDQLTTLALDASGNLYQENVTSMPGQLALLETGIIPGSFAQSNTADNNEYLMLSDLTIGTDRPRIVRLNAETSQLQLFPLSQVGPGAPPSFTATVGSGTGALTITAYALVNDVVTFTFTATATDAIPTPGSRYVVTGTGGPWDGLTLTVLGTPAPTDTTFAAGYVHANTSASHAGTATPTYNYTISSITQLAAVNFNGQILLQSAGPGSTAVGTVVTFFYGSAGAAEDANILAAFAAGNSCVVYINDLPSGAPGAGSQLLTGHGIAIPPSENQKVPYFTINLPTVAPTYLRFGGPGGSGPNGPGNDGNYQISMATLTVASPIPDLAPGDSVQINGASPAGWNNNWTIVNALTSGVLNITSSQMLANGIAQFDFNVQSGVAPVNDQLITLTDLTNLQVLNTTGVVSAATGSTFQVGGFSGAIPAQAASVQEEGLASTFGTQFNFDPGTMDIGLSTPSPIFGNTSSQPGLITVIGGSDIPIGSGTRQAVVFFVTTTGTWTAVSPAVSFTTSEDANYITANNIPIGPPNTIARGIAFTEAGANGVPGANFYVIEEPVLITVGQTVTSYTSTIINDNISTTSKFSFTDQVLLDSTEIDIQGQDLFNLIELGSSAWCVPYASRMFYGLQLNKVTNFNNLSYDGGYLSNGFGGQASSENVVLLGGTYANLQPAGNPQGSVGVNGTGWTMSNNSQQTLLPSPVTGDALYILNSTASTIVQAGLHYQTAYQDQFNVPILSINTTYSVRVACSNPSGIAEGTLTIDLTDFNTGVGFGTSYGSFTIPLSNMSSNIQVFSGPLLTIPFVNTVPSALQYRVYVSGLGPNADCLIDRTEVFPTQTPYLKAQVFGSYVNDLEAIDASAGGGIIDTTTENAQACYGGFTMHNALYLLKSSSWYQTANDPSSEPGGWGLKEVSNKVGTCSIHGYDVGEEWAITICKNGIYGFTGNQPVLMNLEIYNLLQAVNWDAAECIWIKNDVANRRILCGLPLPSGPTSATYQWWNTSVFNPAPTTPNVVLMIDYSSVDTIEELIVKSSVHVTMFGKLMATDATRKFSLWSIASPYADLIYRNTDDNEVFICNGIASSKIYELDSTQYSDDGVGLPFDYITYGHVDAQKAATIPIFGNHNKRWTMWQGTIEGAGKAYVTVIPNIINAKYPYTIPAFTLSSPVNNDYYKPLNIRAQRSYLEFETDGLPGSWMRIDRSILIGRAEPWSPTNPTGGGNLGVTSTGL